MQRRLRADRHRLCHERAQTLQLLQHAWPAGSSFGLINHACHSGPYGRQPPRCSAPTAAAPAYPWARRPPSMPGRRPPDAQLHRPERGALSATTTPSPPATGCSWAGWNGGRLRPRTRPARADVLAPRGAHPDFGRCAVGERFGLIFQELFGQAAVSPTRARRWKRSRACRSIRSSPGHGAAFGNVERSLRRVSAPGRYEADPAKLARHALKVMLSFSLMIEEK